MDFSSLTPDQQNKLFDAELKRIDAERSRQLAEAKRANMITAELKSERARKDASADEARVFPFYTPVASQSVRLCQESLGEWARLEDPPNSEPFTIEITSPGGSVFDGFALIDYIRNLQEMGYVINTFGTGMIASMAGILLQVGNERVMGKNSWLLIHEVSTGSIGKVSEVKDEAKFAERLWDQGLEILASRSKWSKTKIKRAAERKDFWLNAQESVDAGFADKIV